MKFLNYTLSTPDPMLAVDGTFKINSFGYPMLVLTTQDSNHQIYPIAFAPSSSECEQTVTFLLDSVVKAYNILYKKNVNISYFMSDCASYNFTSVSKTVGELKGGHLSCFFYIKEKQREQKLAEHKVEKNDREKILKHIDQMQSMITQKHFKVYWNLLKVKYADYKSYIEYFESTYINSIYNKWHYYDVKPNIFLTNNACESLNALIKRD